ncbi:MAG: GntR family transcriptional regulator [Pirellulales bacterium]|nr:GntR family transcriptional regulator [Pirellulales bacterium]
MSIDLPRASEPAAPRQLLRNEAYAKIKRMILSGECSPGAALSERQLSDRLEMSKTPIRMALERLDSEGLVAISPQQGVFVRELSIHEIADLFEIRLILESYTIRTITGKLTAQQRSAIESLLSQQYLAAMAEDIESSVSLDLEFHLEFCKCLGNHEILRVINQLRDKMLMVFTRHMQRNPSRMIVNQSEHVAIAQQAFAGDKDVAEELLRRHLEYGRDFMLSFRRDDGASRNS